MAHTFVETGRAPVTMVRRACQCGCGAQRLELLHGDGRSIGIPLPRALGQREVASVGHAIAAGRQVVDLFQQVAAVIRTIRK